MSPRADKAVMIGPSPAIGAGGIIGGADGSGGRLGVGCTWAVGCSGFNWYKAGGAELKIG
jgi:hypothetical protein